MRNKLEASRVASNEAGPDEATFVSSDAVYVNLHAPDFSKLLVEGIKPIGSADVKPSDAGHRQLPPIELISCDNRQLVSDQ